MNESTVFTIQSVYKLIVALMLLLVVALGWDLLRNPMPGTLFFFCVSVGLALWSGLTTLQRVELTENSICLSAPLRPQRCVAFRQLISVTEEGRVNPTLTVLYHPQQANGLLDLESAQSLFLPAVQNQEELLAHLQARVPV